MCLSCLTVSCRIAHFSDLTETPADMSDILAEMSSASSSKYRFSWSLRRRSLRHLLLKQREATLNIMYLLLKQREATLNSMYLLLKQREATLNIMYLLLKQREATLNIMYLLLKQREATLNTMYLLLKQREATLNMMQTRIMVIVHCSYFLSQLLKTFVTETKSNKSEYHVCKNFGYCTLL